MTIRSKVPLEKKTLNIREGDWDFLTSIYAPKGVDTSYVVRQLISNVVDKIRAKETVDDSIKLTN